MVDMSKHNFRNLSIWQKGIEISSLTYKMVRTFPDYEKFNLSSQLIRCAVSIPSNIAEGTSKGTVKYFKQYLETSLGSAYEWETQINLAFNEKYISKKEFDNCIDQIQQKQKMILGFSKKLKH